uniref:NR LBD domain-containing protein n=1 Tax=Strongyloides stercoralis TaxID=6248 RepID=A0A0K0EAW5_STRER
MLTNTVEKNVCLVCNAETNSIHNSVNSCRACSAFFRRAITNHKNFRCRRGTNRCIIKPGDKLFCKYCRFKKCKEVGMVLKNENVNNSNDCKLQSQPNEEVEIKNLESQNNNTAHLNNDIKIEDNKVLFDMKQINSYVNQIFLKTETSTSHNDKYFTCLQQIMKGINHLNNNLNYNHPENVIFTKHIELKRFIKLWQKFITFSPSLLMALNEFATLTIKDKWIIFRDFWRNAFILITGTYITKICNPCNEGLLLNDEIYVFKINDAEFIDNEIGEKKSKEVFSLMKPTLMLLHEFVHKPLKDENYDNIEIAYLIVQIIFDKLTLHKTSNECQKIGDEILKVISDEIHNYYVYNKKMYNYAFRLTEMTKLLLFIKEYSTREKEITTISKWMDLIDLSFMDSI